jgi:type IV secretion system protein VirB10
MKAWILATTIYCLSGALLAQTPAPPAVNAQAASASSDTNKKVVVPAGSKVLLELKAAVDTKTAKPGDPVYLTSTFPVIVNDRVVIPAGMDVQGVIDSVVRPGRVKGRAKVTMHFTTLIFPNGSVVRIPGSVNAVPGAGGPTVKGSENTIEQAGTKAQDAHNVETATAAGAGVGGLATIGGGNTGVGVGYGALGGSVAGVAYTLLTRGKDVVLQPGQPLEMALQRPLVLDEKDVYVPPPSTGVQFVPAPNQPRPLPKPQPQGPN